MPNIAYSIVYTVVIGKLSRLRCRVDCSNRQLTLCCLRHPMYIPRYVMYLKWVFFLQFPENFLSLPTSAMTWCYSAPRRRPLFGGTARNQVRTSRWRFLGDSPWGRSLWTTRMYREGCGPCLCPPRTARGPWPLRPLMDRTRSASPVSCLEMSGSVPDKVTWSSRWIW